MMTYLCREAACKCCTRAVVESWASCLHLEFTSEEAVIDDVLPETSDYNTENTANIRATESAWFGGRLLSVLMDGEAGCC